VGVLNGLLANFTPSPDRIGRLFEHLVHHPMVWYMGSERKRINGVDVLPWQNGLREPGW
jgi:hypothetical protein